MRKSDNILNVESLFCSYLVSEDMRFQLAPKYVSFDYELKSWETLDLQQVFKELNKWGNTWLSPSSSRSEDI